MNKSLRVASLILFVFFTVFATTNVSANESRNSKSPYVMLEGRVTFAKARSLVLDNQQYPVSMFVRVFQGDERGPEVPMHVIANTGKIDRARIYILGGKVEKIIVLQNI